MNEIANRMTAHLNKTRRMVLTGLLLALALVLMIAESALPPLPIPVPGVKLGLSNIAVLFALFFLGMSRATAIAVLKSTFVFMMNGAIAGLLSLSGGLLSLAVMILMLALRKKCGSYMALSILGAIFHNVGQFIVVSLLYMDIFLWAYLPVLLIAGTLAGVATAVLLKCIMPAFKRLV